MLELVSLVIGATLTAVIALVVILKNSRSLTNRLFVTLAAGLVGWSITTFFSLHTSTDSQTLGWIRWIMFFVVLQNTSFLLLVSIFPARQFRIMKSKKHVAAIIFSSITAAAALSPYLFTDFKNGAPVPGPGMLLFLPHALLFALGGLVFLAVRCRRAVGVERVQLQYFLAGTVLMFTLVPLGNFVLPVVFESSQFVVFSPLYSIVFAGFIAYGILAKRMFDIRLTIARAVTYLLLLITLVSIYAVGVFGAVRLFFGKSQVSAEQSIVYIVAAVLVAFTFEPLKKFFAKLTNRFFFQDIYDSQEVLDRINSVLVRTVTVDRLASDSLSIINEALKSEFASLVLLSKCGSAEARHIVIGSKKLEPSSLLEHLSKQTTPLLISDELEDRTDSLYEALQRSNVGLAARVETSKEFLGYLFFGYKVNGGIFSSQDIDLIRIASYEFAVAIQNALRFEEIQNFNVTLQQRVEEATRQLRLTNARLKLLDAAKDDFISMASHQLRTPLTSVKGYLSMVLEGDAGALTPYQRKLLEEAYSSSQRMVYLISDFLNVSRLKTGKFVLELSRANLANIIEEEVRKLELTAASRQLKISYQKPANLPPQQCDANKLRQVVMNLLDNAIFYSRPGGTIYVELTHDGRNLILKVKDNGIGVPAAERHNLFSKFFRASNAKKARPDGTGIGLFMAKKVIVAHGGSVIAETTEHKGSTFGFILPLEPSAAVRKQALPTPAATKSG